MNADFSKPYEPKEHESKIYELWEKSGYFNPDKLPVSKIRNSKISAGGGSSSGGKNYIVYMPLPNVTGTLHMGHALDNTFQDIVVRYHRMRGFRTLWLPGTDHAGIATQYVVEKQLRKEGISRFDLGREKFIERVWEWKKEYGGRILDQLRRIGVSADWSRTRFTMDPAYAKDVQHTFIHYYEKGLLYRGERVVNWCPRCGTSLSELELEYEDHHAKLWYFKYPVSKQSPGKSEKKYIVVATTRPETMLGDTAVAVNPKDARYKSFIGKRVLLPIVNREIPIVADEMVDKSFGTGAVKVTPAHDTADYEMGVRHKLPSIKVIDERGKINGDFPEFTGMKAEEVREKIVERFKELGLLEKEEEYRHNIAKCYRCGRVIEPLPSMQWFLKMPELAKKAIAAVKTKKVTITPKNFEKIYLNWLGNIRDWTISRQIWWGHQLPVYFCKNKQEEFPISNDQFSKRTNESFVVATEKPKTCPFCKKCEMEQSPDVLDTWFSSALWPFAGLSESDVKKYYPGNTLITARDILNLWVARMIFSGLEFHGKVPFKDVLIHGTVLAKDGRRMSKSLGTGIDPLNYVEQYGADAMRFGIVWQALGQDIKWDEAAVIAGRKFTNKIWNASRFVLSSVGNVSDNLPKNQRQSGTTPADKKILKSLQKTKKQTENYIETFQFAKALRGLYDFFWHDFCDVYLEASKKQLVDKKLKASTERILLSTLAESLKTLHPFLPFITETIFQELPSTTKNLLLIEKW